MPVNIGNEYFYISLSLSTISVIMDSLGSYHHILNSYTPSPSFFYLFFFLSCMWHLKVMKFYVTIKLGLENCDGNDILNGIILQLHNNAPGSK